MSSSSTLSLGATSEAVEGVAVDPSLEAEPDGRGPDGAGAPADEQDEALSHKRILLIF
jgi:hypothetical protein